MKTVNQQHASGAPRGPGPHDRDSHLAALTRTNHDLRSPLSVILGVFELLEETGSLSDSEQRYVRLGSEAAAELLNQADALRLYSALARDLVTLEPEHIDLGALARERMAPAFERRNMHLDAAGENGLRALADTGYLGAALTSLGKHLANHLNEPGNASATFELRTERKDAATMALSVRSRGGGGPLEPGPEPTPGETDLAVINAIRLIELMRGRVVLNAERGFLHLELPSVSAL